MENNHLITHEHQQQPMEANSTGVDAKMNPAFPAAGASGARAKFIPTDFSALDLEGGGEMNPAFSPTVVPTTGAGVARAKFIPTDFSALDLEGGDEMNPAFSPTVAPTTGAGVARAKFIPTDFSALDLEGGGEMNPAFSPTVAPTTGAGVARAKFIPTDFSALELGGAPAEDLHTVPFASQPRGQDAYDGAPPSSTAAWAGLPSQTISVGDLGAPASFTPKRRRTCYCIALLVALLLLLIVPLIIVAAIRARRKGQFFTPILPEMKALYEGQGFTLSTDFLAVHKTKQYVFTNKPSGCPFIFSVSHGGLYNISGLGYPERFAGLKELDTRTIHMISATYDEIKRLTNGKCVPCVVALNLKRAWADVNRGAPYYNELTAFDSDEGKFAWNMYFQQLDRCISSVQGGKMTPLVLDIHGNSDEQFYGTVIPGTTSTQGATLPSLKRRDGSTAYPGVWFQPAANGGFFTLLETNSSAGTSFVIDRTILSNSSAPSDPNYTGVIDGYIIRRVGLEQGVNTLTLDFSMAYRYSLGMTMDSARNLAQALVTFGSTAGGWPPRAP